MQRVCFTLQVRPECIDIYRAKHREVWPEMRQALAEAGWRDYSLFLRADGLLIGYLITEDFEASKAAMKGLEVNDRWQQAMSSYFHSLETHADTGMEPIEEVFHLD